MSENVPPFSISADCQGRTQAAKRGDPSSAMVLADDWAEHGCRNIKIADGAGIIRDRDQFRANLRLVKRLRHRALSA